MAAAESSAADDARLTPPGPRPAATPGRAASPTRAGSRGSTRQGSKARRLLGHYAERLPAVELNNTFYQQPTAAKVAAWLAATPPDFRFSVKAQRGGSWRAMREPSPEPGMPWLTEPYRAFGERLGTVLFRIPDNVQRDDERLAGAARGLAARPAADPRVRGSVAGRSTR